MNAERVPVALTLRPWWRDHHVAGKAVLPAVETLLLLAETVVGLHRDINPCTMEQAVFNRFLHLPPDAASLPLEVELRRKADGVLRAALLSRVRGKTMSRLQEHGAVCFPDRTAPVEVLPHDQAWSEQEVDMCIPAATIYEELVPFGPGYHTLSGRLLLSPQSAVATLHAPVIPLSAATVTTLGSPFPLDGAMHAACVLGQRLVDFVPFPVGFAHRRVLSPTKPGDRYHARIRLTRQSPEELLFDLVIDDTAGRQYEIVTGLRMRDVSGGRRRGPEWIRKPSRAEGT